MNEDRLRAYLKGRFRGYRDDLPVDAELSGIVDSLGLFELVEFVEQTFDVRIPMAEFRPGRFSSIREILDFVDDLRSRETRLMR
jgi:acyl carrier protein